MTDSSATSTASVTAKAATASARGRAPRLRWQRLALTILLLLTGFVVARERFAFRVDDGFIDFEPDVSQFPAAPVADAHTDFGIGRPIGWPGAQYYCPYDTSVSSSSDSSAFGNDWHTVRHDWTEDGAAKAWIVGERTRAFRNLGQFDEYLEGFRNRTKYCGWTYQDSAPRTNSILTELDGLPDGAIAFTADLSPYGLPDRELRDSDLYDFHALGAVLPGRKRGQLMTILWVGWGTDVPHDQFVAAANRLYDAAHRSPKTDDDFGDDTIIDYRFTPFDPELAGVVPMIGGDDGDNIPHALVSHRCRRQLPAGGLWRSSTAGYRATVGVSNDSRVVTFGASRWKIRSKYLEAKQRSVDAVAARCVGSYQPRTMLIEPVTLAGLPEGTLVSKWEDEYGSYGALITDDDKQMLMIVTWFESDGVPEDTFVAVVNRAWDQFQADNP